MRNYELSHRPVRSVAEGNRSMGVGGLGRTSTKSRTMNKRSKMIEGITREEPEDYKKHKQHLLEAQSSRKTEDSVHFSYNEDELKTNSAHFASQFRAIGIYCSTGM